MVAAQSQCSVIHRVSFPFPMMIDDVTPGEKGMCAPTREEDETEYKASGLQMWDDGEAIHKL